MKMLKDRKGQISEGITWLAATIIIIVILTISVFVTSIYSRDKKINGGYFSSNVNQKGLLGWLLTSDSKGGNVYSNLALKVFAIYEKQYSGMWIGIDTIKGGFLGIGSSREGNDYFDLSSLSGEGDASFVTINKDKVAEAVFTK